MKSGGFWLGVLVGASMGATLALRWRQAAQVKDEGVEGGAESSAVGQAAKRLRQSWVVLILPISIGNIYTGGAK